ncbi:MAG: tRNA pseudouridine(13) synthase TruD [Candidatus Woesearchaeota archaeon]
MIIKSKPEDFIVEEINNLILVDNGKYSYYILKKTNLDTQAAIQKLTDLFGVNPKYVNFAGTKDKIAITTQYISIFHGPEKNITTENCEVTFIGKGNDRLNLGMLHGNTFTITVRNITKKEKNAFKIKQFVNYYDDQRFGTRKNTHALGKLLVKKEFKGAVLEAQSDHYPYLLLKKYLEKCPTDYVGALRELPKKLLLMFVHGYQSYLWNETVKEYLKRIKHTKIEYSLGELYVPLNQIEDREIPLISFDIETDKEMQKILDTIMKKEEITERNFIIRQMPEIVAPGGNRKLLIECKNFSENWIDDSVVILKFTLGKGSYATMVVKQLFC